LNFHLFRSIRVIAEMVGAAGGQIRPDIGDNAWSCLHRLVRQAYDGHMTAENKPQLLVTAFSDYICPFCYVGDARLQKLRDSYDLKINWRFVEIHPQTPAEGMPLSKLGYTEERWQMLMDNLKQLVKTDGLPLSDRTFTTRSHSALLLAEAAKSAGAAVFYDLHEKLFQAFFVANLNIGDESLLRKIAAGCGLPESTINEAWTDPKYRQRLEQNLSAARQIGLTGVPTFIINNTKLTGAVPEEGLRKAAAG